MSIALLSGVTHAVSVSSVGVFGNNVGLFRMWCWLLLLGKVVWYAYH